MSPATDSHLHRSNLLASRCCALRDDLYLTVIISADRIRRVRAQARAHSAGVPQARWPPSINITERR
jgi:hypothetical protein